MKKKFLVWLKYKLSRRYLRVKSSLNDKLNDEQKNGIKIVKSLAVRHDSEILMAPLTDRYFIKNNEIFIILDLNTITIINSVYHYDIYITNKINLDLSKFIRRIIEKKRNKMEREIREKIEKSLGHIAVALTATS